uniref:RNase H type-1 domain-containing protein n=1 Tax=viral metagenome TaxID=1070528 RepID=A0A6C0D307_9ZZZZ
MIEYKDNFTFNFMYTLYFDGCSKGNPGPAGSGAIIKNETNHNDIIWSGSENIGIATNNVAEYKGLILGLKHCTEGKYLIKGDSMLIINQMNGKYKINSAHLLILHNEAKQIIKENKLDVTFLYIPRAENKEADQLANDGLKQDLI